MGSEQERRLAASEAIARQENEGRSAWFAGHRTVTFRCECSDPACGESIGLIREEYETVRRSDRRFFVAPNHDIVGAENIVVRNPHYWVVEKSSAPGAEEIAS